MPDFTTEYHWRCSALGASGSVGGYSQRLDGGPDGPNWTCTCKAFKFSKIPIYKRSCKHLKIHLASLCTWEALFDGGEPVDGKCPRCGQPAISEGYAV